MTEMTQIDQELYHPLLQYANLGTMKESLQKKIAYRLWNCSHGFPNGYKSGITTYFGNFQKEINLWSLPKKQNLVIDTYADFLDLVEHLTAHKDKRRDSEEILRFFPVIETKLRASGKVGRVDTKAPLAVRYKSTTQEEVDNSIELTIGLWLMIYLGPSDPDIFLGLGRSHAEWPQNATLEQFLTTNFTTAPGQAVSKGAQFSKDLTARNLDRIGGFQIMWTSSLKNHLTFDDDTMTVVLYHFASVLSLHENKNRRQSILPDGLAEETRRTLALLLPRSDNRSKHWFNQELKRIGGALDPKATSQSLGSGGRSIESFKFWQERLCIIDKAFNDAEPRGFKARWFDRRNGLQWANFWMAMTVLILTAFFGLISALTGIIQVYYAARSQ